MSQTVPPRRAKSRRIYLSTRGGLTRLAIWEDGALREVRHQEIDENHQAVGAVFLGRVVRVMPGLQAAFVDILPGVTGFLSARDGRRRIGEGEERAGPIESLCHEGENLVVQVTAEAYGDKGPRLSTDITFASEHMIFSPTRSGALISSRIHDKAERVRLKELGGALLASQSGGDQADCGLILRTQAAKAPKNVLELELSEALANWSAVSGAIKSAKTCTQLSGPIDVVESCLRNFAASTDAFVTDDKAQFRQLQDYFKDRDVPQPDLLFEAGRNLFEAEGLEDEIDQAMAERVALPGGGWISIGETDALTAIDVNSGSAERAGSASTLALRTNEEAAVTTARQVRLRGLSGLFVIDFIEMKRVAHRETVRQLLVDELGLDPAPCRVGSFSEFGLLEFTRQRSGPPLSHFGTRPTNKN